MGALFPNEARMLLFVDHLTNVDFSFLDERRGLLGETWLANVQLKGDLDDQGMVCDFGIVKKRLRQWLDEELDHRLLVPIRSRSEERRVGKRWTCGEEEATEKKDKSQTARERQT